MGEPVPVKEELERALASMRAGFLSGSSQITAGVASLEEHLAGARPDERERVGAAVAQIVGTQERLIAHIERMPAAPWDRFKSMVGILKAQQAILDDLSDLLKEHVLPRQLEGLSAAAASAAAPPSVVQQPAPPLPQPPPRRRRVEVDTGPPERTRRGTGLKGLAAMVVAALVLSLIPRESKVQETVTRLFSFVSGGGEPAPADASSAKADAKAPRVPVPAPRVPHEPEEPEVADGSSPDEKSAGGKRDAAAARERPAKVASQSSDKRGAAPQGTAKPPPAGRRQEQFVPILFTHKDQETVLKRMGDLQERYPKLLTDRKGEIVPVNMGKKGVWHRLAFLPAVSRPEAGRFCERLMAEGYDRCWVYNYEAD
jgi:hypothetical protein